MRVTDITIEIHGTSINLYRLGDCIVCVVADGECISGYQIDDKFFAMALKVVDQAGLVLSMKEVDALAEVLVTVAADDLLGT